MASSTLTRYSVIVYHMTQQILVPMDTSASATAALEHVLNFFPASEISVLHVVDVEASDSFLQRVLPEECDEQRKAAERTAKTVLEHAQTVSAEYEREITTAIASGRPTREITAYAEENDLDVIVMGTHGRSGLSRLLLGSLSDVVMRRSSVPVMIVREPIETDQTKSTSLPQNQKQFHGAQWRRWQARLRQPSIDVRAVLPLSIPP